MSSPSTTSGSSAVVPPQGPDGAAAPASTDVVPATVADAALDVAEPALDARDAEVIAAARSGHPVFVYSLERLGLLVASGIVLWVIGVDNPYWLVMLALVVSGLASFVLLWGRRAQVSARIVGRRGAISRRIDEATAREDAWLDAAEAKRAEAESDADRG